MRIDIKRIRKEKGYSQEKLADKLELSVRTIFNVENYINKHTEETVEKVLKELDIEMSYEEYIEACNNKPGDFFIGKMEIDSTKSPVVKGKLKEKLIEADELCRNKKYQNALDIYLSFSKLLGDEKCYLIGCALSYQGLGQYEDAIKYCDKILEDDKCEYDALTIKGTALGLLKKYDESIEVLKEVTEIKEDHVLYYNLGVAYLMKKDFLNAIDKFNKCLDMKGEFPSAHLDIAICYLKTFKHDKCIEHLEKVIEMEEDMYQVYAVMGSCYKDMGEHEKAILYYKKCLEVDDENYEALYGIFMCLAIIGRIDEAQIYSDKFFQLYPDAFFYKNKESIKKKDFVFIGSTELSDETASVSYPTLGKVFFDKSRFDETVSKIKESTSLFQYFDKPIYVDFNKEVKVNILGLENNVLIEMVFGKYSLIETNTDSTNLENFRDLLEKYHQFRIQLKYKSNLFIIDCLKNITFKL